MKNTSSILMKRIVIVATLIIFNMLSGIYSPIGAALLKVPKDYKTIQSAINVAKTGDVICVAQGTYKENIVLKKNVILEGGYNTTYSARNWTNWPSIIDGDKNGSVVIGADGARLDGFTIKNGSAKEGGGIYLTKGTMTIQNNTIENNVAQNNGGGIYLGYTQKAPPYTDIKNNIIRRNKVTTNVGGTGGGIYIEHCETGIRITENTIGGKIGDGNSSVAGGAGIMVEFTPIFTIEENTISQNTVNQGHGGGVYISDGTPNATLCQNIISYNSINSGNYGGGVYSIGGTYICRNMIAHNTILNSLSWGGGLMIDCPQGTSPRIENNFILSNMVNKEGGGIYVYRGDYIILMNNSIMGNLPDNAQSGGGIYVKADATCIIQNNILWNNGDDFHEETTGSCTLDHNDIEDGDELGKNGNISANPLFVAYDDLHIKKGSPAIDTGNKAAAPNLDYDGDTRPSKVDIGADEYVGEDSQGPCPFAKAAQASYLEPYICNVRHFRDTYMITNAFGRAITHVYYKMAPAFSAYLEDHTVALKVTRWLSTPLVMAIVFPQGLLTMLLTGVGAGVWQKLKRKRK